MTKHYPKILLFAALIAAGIVIRSLPVGDMISIENVKRSRELLVSSVERHYLLSVLSFIAAYIVIVALSIPGGAVMTLTGGFLFGVLPGALYVNAGATAGATLAFLAARYLIGDWLQIRYEGQLRKFNEEMNRNGFRYLISLRLVPVFPFFMINILSGFTNLRTGTFIWTTAVGIVPATFIFAYAGRQIGSISSLSEVLSGRVIAAFIILSLFALVPVLTARLRSTTAAGAGKEPGSRKGEDAWTRRHR